MPVCGNCGALDSLSWTAPPADESTGPVSVEMLPLIVGAPEPVSGEIVLSEDLDDASPEGEEADETHKEEPAK